MKIILTTAFIAVVSFGILGQTEDDMARFSRLGFTGSARYMGMGGAMGALGADFSSVTVNPAGMARVSSSVFTFTPSLDMSNSIGVFNNNETRDANAGVGLPDISLIRHFTETSGKWNSFQVGIGYTRLNDLDNVVTYEGNSENSILHDFAESANGLDFDPQFGDAIQDFRPFTSNLAYESFAIDPATDEFGNLVFDDEGNIFYVSQIPYGTTVRQRREVIRTGRQGEFNLALSGNYNNKLYVGAALGIQQIRFREDWQHSEDVVDTAGLFIRNLDYLYSLEIRGVGVNFRVGAIYIPIEWLRVGASIQTPTRFNMTDSWNADMRTEFYDAEYDYYGIQGRPTGRFQYVMTTPFRGTISAAYLLRKRGILSVDLEYVDYRMGNFKPRRSDEFTDYTSTNFSINDRLSNAFNLRVGADVRIVGNFSWRFGMGFYGNPYNDQVIETNPNRRYITTGFGLRFEKFSLDVGYMMHRRNEDYFAYNTEQDGPNVALFRNRNSVFSATFGFRF